MELVSRYGKVLGTGNLEDEDVRKKRSLSAIREWSGHLPFVAQLGYIICTTKQELNHYHVHPTSKNTNTQPAENIITVYFLRNTTTLVVSPLF